ncbi:MAG: hypothetical protein ACYC7E_22050 [Armatimonadota bacterium]
MINRILSLALLLLAAPLLAAPAAPLSALAQMPVKEVTVFKDGHAFLLHQGAMPTDGMGNVLMDYLPTPVFGAFWPFAVEKGAKLAGVVSGQRKVLVERTALTFYELLEANAGKAVIITETGGTIRYSATIVGLLKRSGEELERTAPPNTGDLLPQKGNLVMLTTEDGVKVLPIERIQDITFKTPAGQMQTLSRTEEFRNLLTLKLDWGRLKPAATADVGLLYLQKGVRWIPGYKVVIDGKGSAQVKLQATLVNELTDLNDVTVNLVIGVPTFAFKDHVDPIALQQTTAQLSPVFREDSRTRMSLSNSMMTQVAAQSLDYDAAPAGPALPALGGSGKTEDLFVFTVKHVTLKKHERLVLPVAEFPLKYKDIYTLELPFAPPPEVYRGFNFNQQRELARLLGAPKVLHQLRLQNSSDYPLTTAPALIFSGDRLLAQGMMTYTPPGAAVDLPLTQAVDIQVKKTEKEVKRTPNAVRWNNDDYLRVDLAGTLTLTNRLAEPAALEVTRYVLGTAEKADHDGVITMANVYEDNGFVAISDVPPWWSWYNWPYWWGRFNGVARITWKLTLDPGKAVDLGYNWYYYWR